MVQYEYLGKQKLILAQTYTQCAPIYAYYYNTTQCQTTFPPNLFCKAVPSGVICTDLNINNGVFTLPYLYYWNNVYNNCNSFCMGINYFCLETWGYKPNCSDVWTYPCACAFTCSVLNGNRSLLSRFINNDVQEGECIIFNITNTVTTCVYTPSSGTSQAATACMRLAVNCLTLLAQEQVCYWPGYMGNASWWCYPLTCTQEICFIKCGAAYNVKIGGVCYGDSPDLEMDYYAYTYEYNTSSCRSRGGAAAASVCFLINCITRTLGNTILNCYTFSSNYCAPQVVFPSQKQLFYYGAPPVTFGSCCSSSMNPCYNQPLIPVNCAGCIGSNYYLYIDSAKQTCLTCVYVY